MNKLSLIDVLKETCGVISKNKKFVYKTAAITSVLLFLAQGSLIKLFGGNNSIVYIFSVVCSLVYYLIWSIPMISMSRYVLLDEIPSGNIFLKWNPQYTRYFLYSIRLWISVYFRGLLFSLALIFSVCIVGFLSYWFFSKIITIDPTFINSYIFYALITLSIIIPFMYFYLERIFYGQVISLDIEENPLVCSKKISKGNIVKLFLLSGFYWAPILIILIPAVISAALAYPTIVIPMKSTFVSFVENVCCTASSFFGCIAFAVAYKKITQNSLGDEIVK